MTVTIDDPDGRFRVSAFDANHCPDEKQTPELCFTLYKEYGTTMAGLMAIGYNFDYDDFHAYVHGILPYEILKPDYVLKHLLPSLPIRKVVFTNADKRHAARVISRLGLEECFEQIISFETLNPIVKADESDHSHPKKSGIIVHSYEPISDSEAPKTPVVCKPFEDAYEQVFKIADINPKRTVMQMGDMDDSVKAKRFTVGTICFVTLVRAVDTIEVKQELYRNGYTHLVVQMDESCTYPQM